MSSPASSEGGGSFGELCKFSLSPEVPVPLSVELDIPIGCLVAAARRQSYAEEVLCCLLIKHFFLVSSKAKIYFLHVALEDLLPSDGTARCAGELSPGSAP